MTIVMPRATSMSGALLRRMSISAPYSWPSRTVTAMNWGRAIVLTTIQRQQGHDGPEEPVFTSFFMLRCLPPCWRCSR